MNLKEIVVTLWTGFIWLRIGTSGGCCEHSNGSWGSMTS